MPQVVAIEDERLRCGKSSHSRPRESVDLPDPDRPVSQTTHPLWPLRIHRWSRLIWPSDQKMFWDFMR